MKPLRVMAFAGLALGLTSVQAMAQPVISAKSGVAAFSEGDVFLANQKLVYSPTHFEDLKENQVLRTEGGRAEVLLTPGVVLRMGENSSLRMITNRLIDTRLELVTGSAVIEADQIAKDTNVTIAVKDAQVALTKSGIYRFDAEPARVRVFKGSAAVALDGQTVDVSGGKMLMLGGEKAEVSKFDENDTDALDRWSGRRAESMAMANLSAAKTLMGSGTLSSMGWGTGSCYSGAWSFNSWYGMMTYVPCNGAFMSPYGYRFYSPYSVYSVYNPTYYRPPTNGGGFNGGMPYNAAAPTSGGYSGVMASPASSASMGGMPSGAMSGSTASASAGAGSAGHGASGGGAASGGAAAGGHGR
ncbi:MAG TPA: FecR domain-containing protein [Candidatus Limnocylindrales bacterium]|nr:FecR domain-containing protein [Candidatus Limnocylindrales bacterium]